MDYLSSRNKSPDHCTGFRLNLANQTDTMRAPYVPVCKWHRSVAQHYSFLLVCSILLLVTSKLQAQQPAPKFSRQDTLRGTITPERAWWDVLYYDIRVTPEFNTKTISGDIDIHFKVLGPGRTMQIDLQEPMEITAVSFNKQPISFRRDGNAWFLNFPSAPAAGTTTTITIQFSGKPREAVRPPWDGGWIWKTDEKGRPWMSVACQGLGASVWYPCKDHQSDEPDHGAALTMIVPDTLVAVANGRLQQKTSINGKTAWRWGVQNPINNYNIIPYIGKYVTWHETFQGEKGPLDCDYWVLDYNLEKAKEQFKQVPRMLQCFEYWFGPYPFYEDGYKLVEAPHLGMEHQSAVAYGNGFANGYRGQDLSGSGWGKQWDFIIIHESGHEWFANNITTNDIADMWVHEGFTNYSETLFTTCEFGVEAGNDYCIGTRSRIQNDIPIIGHYGVNNEGSGDMYYKGGNLLHTVRQIINNDSLFRQILRGLNSTFYHKTVDSRDVEAYISKQCGKDLSKVFDQYLRTVEVPVLEYKVNGNQLQYRWTQCVEGFNMPLKVQFGGEKWITPTTNWQTLSVGGAGSPSFTVDRNFYIRLKKTE
jgi:Aminopeptidase N